MEKTTRLSNSGFSGFVNHDITYLQTAQISHMLKLNVDIFQHYFDSSWYFNIDKKWELFFQEFRHDAIYFYHVQL